MLHLHEGCPAAPQRHRMQHPKSLPPYLGCQWVLVGTCHNVKGLASLVVAQPAPARALHTAQHNESQHVLEQYKAARQQGASDVLWHRCDTCTTAVVLLHALPQALRLSWHGTHSSYLHCCCGGVECTDEVVKAAPLGLDGIQQCTTAGGGILHTQQGESRAEHRITTLEAKHTQFR